MVNMNRLDTAKQAQVVAALVEGNSIRATVRMTGVAKNTIAKLLLELGAACSHYMNKALVNLNCQRVQVDEIWSFVGAKQKNVTAALAAKGPAGDVWTWVAIDADSKLIMSWMVGVRTNITATAFIQDLASRLSNRIQLTSDGLNAYITAVERVFGADVDYAQLVKVFGQAKEGATTRYSPPECIGCDRKAITGDPDPKHINTSYIERQNLTMRMSMRRFTRLTNAFSKKLENHVAAIALHYMHYNFVRIHQTLRVTPAMEAGVATSPWTIHEILALLGPL
jgi:IS1 family transposase